MKKYNILCLSLVFSGLLPAQASEGFPNTNTPAPNSSLTNNVPRPNNPLKSTSAEEEKNPHPFEKRRRLDTFEDINETIQQARTGDAEAKILLMELYQAAADQGYAPAQNNLGELHCDDLGVDADYHRAMELFQAAADQGYAPAQNNLGEMYYYGLGVDPDGHRAMELYQAAADQGYAPAQNNLGGMYYDGMGADPDYHRAMELYQAAADQGYAPAQCNLGGMYLIGKKVEKNFPLAMHLFVKAAQEDYEPSKNRLRSFFYLNKAENSNILTQPLEGPDELKESLNNLKDWYMFFETFGSGRYQDTFSQNSFLINLSSSIVDQAQIYIDYLNHFNQPGFMISCLNRKDSEIRPDMLTEFNKLEVRIDGESYLSFVPCSLDLYETSEFEQSINNLKTAYDDSLYYILKLQNERENATLEAILLGMRWVLEKEKPLISTFMDSFIIKLSETNSLEERQDYLEKVTEHINKQVTILSEHLAFARSLHANIIALLKETEEWRNSLFINKVWQ